MSTWKCGTCGLFNSYSRNNCQACFHDIDEYETIIANNYKNKHEQLSKTSRPYLFVFGFVRQLLSSSKSVAYDIKYLIYLFYPKRYHLSSNNFQRLEFEDKLKLLSLAYDHKTKQLFLSGKKLSNEWNVNESYNSDNKEWIKFNNKPPYYWQIQKMLNVPDNDYCIQIVKDRDINLRYLLFNKTSLKWNKSINKLLPISTKSIYAQLEEDDGTTRMFVRNAVIIKRWRYLILLLARHTYFDSTQSNLEVIVYDINNILEPKYVMKNVFNLDYDNWDIIQHPLYFDKLILFGGRSLDRRVTQNFMDTFMTINIDKDGMKIEEEIDYDYEDQFGADSIENVLDNVLLNKVHDDTPRFMSVNGFNYNMTQFRQNTEYEYVPDGVMSIGNQLFLFGGYCQEKRTNSILIYDFIENKWMMSNVKIPKLMKCKVIADRHRREIHLFGASHKHYDEHFVLKLKELC